MGWISSAVSSVTDALGITSSDAAAAESGQPESGGVDWGNVAGNVVSGLVGGAGGAAAGYYVGTTVAARRRGRSRKRRYPTALQWARFQQANDMLTGHPNSTSMKKQLSWRFFSRYKWI